MNKPRFLFVQRHHHLRALGGAEIQCWMMATELARRGWDVHYASEMNIVPDPPVVDGVTLHGLPENPVPFIGNRSGMKTLLQELQPDVILNQVCNIYTAYSILYAPRHSFTIYLGAANLEGFFWRFVWGLRGDSSLLHYLMYLPLSLYYRWMGVRGVKRANLVLAQHLKQHGEFMRAGIESVILRNVQHSVPQENVQTHAGEAVILWAGSIKDIKRPDLFIELARRCSDLPAKFVMVGAIHQDEYRKTIAEAVNSLTNFEYAGFVPFDQVNRFFSAAHLLVCTSISEGFPNTFIQAWMHGVPVVSLGIDPESIIQEKQLGVCASTMDDVETAVRNLIANPDQRREIGKRARDFSEGEFDLTKVVDRLETMLRERGVQVPT